MIKRLYLANGTLQTSLSKCTDDLTVDSATATYILSVLGIGDWAYLAVSYLSAIEIVKVYLTYAGLQVDRAQDGTDRVAFPAGATVTYTLTQAEITDATTPAPLQLYANLATAMQVAGSNGSYTVSYPDITVSCEGGIQAYYTDIDATLHLDNWFPAAGCCSAAGNGAPLIGGPDFYFTSQPYSVEYIELGYVAPNPNTRANNWGNNGFGLGPVWPLTQPLIAESVKNFAYLSYVNVFGHQGFYTATEAYIIPTGMTVFGVTTFGSEGFYTDVEQYVKSNAYVLQMSVFGNAVQYNNDVEKYVKSIMAINSLTVA